MNYQETLDYINSVRHNQWKLGLSRTIELLHMLGDPQNELKFVHVGGTNGKGSTCAMIESVLREAGYRTGIFPSPYIEDFRERIRVNGEMISEEDLCRITDRVRECADSMEDVPSHFEIVTAIGMLYFRDMRCDIVVLEVGLGGEFDATNIIEPPEVAVLTNIGFDHTDYLGNTLAEIARTKSGIIKTDSPVVVYPNVPEVINVVTDICRERGCPMEIVDFGRISIEHADLDGQILSWNGREFKIPLIGEYQSRNAATALTVIEKLRGRGWVIPDEAVDAGMANVAWPARFEVLGKDPLFILDGGHNLQCAEAVADSVRKYLPGTKVTLIIGMLRDKDYAAVLDIILPLAERCLCLTPASDRALHAAELAEMITQKGGTAEVYASAQDAVSTVLRGDRPVLAFGSLYMAGEVRSAYRNIRCQAQI
ncbi:MAG: bifunctional folylpolyglutamate synthase/dihydrofolate synthase [Mogibacterium sp.]|nr:bifunctional folylpolyglutamate synthase/dihydrofolate synthase [Mogibacterium sp.]